MNTAVMECYFLSRLVEEEGKPVRGYRRRMHNIWNEQCCTEITEQCLRDHARMIRKNECITKLELENIRRKVLQKKKKIQKRTIIAILVNVFIKMKRIYMRTESPRLIRRI